MQSFEASFVTSAPTYDAAPPPRYPEVAVLGRSNAGKSTFINRLCGKKDLARVSTTPGRTASANFFLIETAGGRSSKKPFFLVDLPGYGYAKVAKRTHSAFLALVESYLTERSSLSVVILVIDARRTVEGEEEWIQQVTYERSLPLFVVLSKTDKLNQRERQSAFKTLSTGFKLTPPDLYLSAEPTSISQLRAHVAELANQFSGAGGS